jgi:hypothetical protein
LAEAERQETPLLPALVIFKKASSHLAQNCLKLSALISILLG